MVPALSQTSSVVSNDLRILVVDDHLLVGETMARSLSLIEGFEVTSASDIDTAITMIAEGGRFDVILLDYEMPDMDGLKGMNRLIRENAGGVSLFSGAARWAVVERAIDQGAAGYIPKTSRLKTLEHAIRMIADGETYLPAEYMRRSGQDETATLDMKPTERKVLMLLCDGLTNKEIGREIDLDEVTVKMHVRSLFRKLDVRNRTQAVLAAQKLGFCE